MTPNPHCKPTSRNSDLYLNRRDACLAEAKAEPLPRVRERSLRAAAAWQAMYDQARLFEKRQGR